MPVAADMARAVAGGEDRGIAGLGEFSLTTMPSSQPSPASRREFYVGMIADADQRDVRGYAFAAGAHGFNFAVASNASTPVRR